MAAAGAAMTVGGCDRIMDREAPASLLCCFRGARREARGPVGGRHCEVRSGSCMARTKSAGDVFRTIMATQSSWGLARGERVSGVGETWRTLAGSLHVRCSKRFTGSFCRLWRARLTSR